MGPHTIVLLFRPFLRGEVGYFVYGVRELKGVDVNVSI